MLRRARRVLLLGGFLQVMGCGPTDTAPPSEEARAQEETLAAEAVEPPEDTAAVSPGSEESEARGEREPPAQPVSDPTVDPEIEFDGQICVLRAEGGVVSASCDGGSLACAELMRADITDAEGDEVVARCDDEQSAGRALVVASGPGDALLWVGRLDQVLAPGPRSCPFTDAAHISLVDAVPGARRELLVQIRGCNGSGEFTDADALFAWRAEGMVAVATAGVDCQFTGDTGSADAPPPPAGEEYECEGAYLDVVEGAVARVGVGEPVLVSARRDEAGRIVLGTAVSRTPLEWSPAPFRFVRP
ncbi:MAG: hypothetical protein AB8I08_11420 [Sandaracinaceae bacterium]